MPADAYRDAYLESDVLTADPLELVRILLRAAGDAVREARRLLAAADIRGRSHQICRAVDILAELSLSVDRSQPTEVTNNLVELYDYIQRLLNDANIRQADAPLDEAQHLLATLLEAFCAARIPQTRKTEEASEYAPLTCAF